MFKLVQKILSYWVYYNHYAGDIGNRYDHLLVGGKAGQELATITGSPKTGWFLFPPAHPEAHWFTFHDDDNDVQIPNLPRLWP